MRREGGRAFFTDVFISSTPQPTFLGVAKKKEEEEGSHAGMKVSQWDLWRGKGIEEEEEGE